MSDRAPPPCLPRIRISLGDPAARFNDLGPGWHDEQAGRDRKIRSHLRQLKALGLDVTVNPAAA